jgi:hypothetical protein
VRRSGTAASAVAFEVPDLWWQAGHGWATIAMTEALNQKNGGLARIGTWVVGRRQRGQQGVVVGARDGIDRRAVTGGVDTGRGVLAVHLARAPCPVREHQGQR